MLCSSHKLDSGAGGEGRQHSRPGKEACTPSPAPAIWKNCWQCGVLMLLRLLRHEQVGGLRWGPWSAACRTVPRLAAASTAPPGQPPGATSCQQGIGQPQQLLLEARHVWRQGGGQGAGWWAGWGRRFSTPTTWAPRPEQGRRLCTAFCPPASRGRGHQHRLPRSSPPPGQQPRLPARPHPPLCAISKMQVSKRSCQA